MTGRPAAWSALALASTLSVADSAMADSLRESGARSVTPMRLPAEPGARFGWRTAPSRQQLCRARRPASTLGGMGAWMWGAVVMAIVLIVAGGITWWIANGCKVAIIGAVGAILGGLAALACLAILIDPEAALRVSPILTVISAVWLLSWALASGIRAQRLARAVEAPVPVAAP